MGSLARYRYSGWRTDRSPHNALALSTHSPSINSIDDLPQATVDEFNVKIDSLFELSQHLYQEMLTAGVAKECARDVLPLASPTKLYMNGTLRSWLHYTDLRCANGTQLEHKQIALEVKLLIQQQFPTVYSAMFCA